MNQILYTAEGKTKGPLPINTIVRFFAICIIILGVVFIGESIFSMFSYNSSPKDIIDDTLPVIEFANDRK